MAHIVLNGRGQVTERTIKELPLTDKGQAIYWHPEVPGFGVVCGKTSRSYIAQGKVMVGGRRRDRRITIGSVETWSLDEALVRGRKKLVQMGSGIDPKEVAREEALVARVEGWTLRSMLERMRQRKGTRYGPGYGADLERYMADMLDLKAAEITGRLVNERYWAIQEQVKKRRKTTGVATANRVMRDFRAIWNYIDGIDEELGRNPVKSLRHDWISTPTKSDRIPEEKLGEFWQAIWDQPFVAGRDVVIFMLLTGFRRRVACSLGVDEWDSEAGVIRFGAGRMKGGKEWSVPVSTQVKALLDRRMSVTVGDEWLFEGKMAGRGKRRKSVDGWVKEPRYALDRVAKEVGFECSIHGLRRTFSSEAIPVIGEVQRKMLMGHSLGGDVTTAHYSVMGLEALRPAAQAVSDKIVGYGPDWVIDRIRTGEVSGNGMDSKAIAEQQLANNEAGYVNSLSIKPFEKDSTITVGDVLEEHWFGSKLEAEKMALEAKKQSHEAADKGGP